MWEDVNTVSSVVSAAHFYDTAECNHMVHKQVSGVRQTKYQLRALGYQ